MVNRSGFRIAAFGAVLLIDVFASVAVLFVWAPHWLTWHVILFWMKVIINYVASDIEAKRVLCNVYSTRWGHVRSVGTIQYVVKNQRPRCTVKQAILTHLLWLYVRKVACSRMFTQLLHTHWDLCSEKASDKFGSKAGQACHFFLRVSKTVRPIFSRVSFLLTCEP